MRGRFQVPRSVKAKDAGIEDAIARLPLEAIVLSARALPDARKVGVDTYMGYPDMRFRVGSNGPMAYDIYPLPTRSIDSVVGYGQSEQPYRKKLEPILASKDMFTVKYEGRRYSLLLAA